MPQPSYQHPIAHTFLMNNRPQTHFQLLQMAILQIRLSFSVPIIIEEPLHPDVVLLIRINWRILVVMHILCRTPHHLR